MTKCLCPKVQMDKRELRDPIGNAIEFESLSKWYGYSPDYY